MSTPTLRDYTSSQISRWIKKIDVGTPVTEIFHVGRGSHLQQSRPATYIARPATVVDIKTNKQGATIIVLDTGSEYERWRGLWCSKNVTSPAGHNPKADPDPDLYPPDYDHDGKIARETVCVALADLMADVKYGKVNAGAMAAEAKRISAEIARL